MSEKRYIAYYRVSTKRQGESGLGLEAQRKAVKDYLSSNGWPPVKEFTEVESGKRGDRPELEAAIEACRLHQATLVIAKLDRLARNATFLLNLQDSGIEFVACDMPQANRLTIGILAMVAEEEAKAISERTKAALAAAKARGVKLGTAGPRNLRNTLEGGRKGRATNSRRAQERVNRVAHVVQPMREAGASYRTIARALDEKQIPPSRGGKWQAAQVKRVVDRLTENHTST